LPGAAWRAGALAVRASVPLEDRQRVPASSGQQREDAAQHQAQVVVALDGHRRGRGVDRPESPPDVARRERHAGDQEHLRGRAGERRVDQSRRDAAAAHLGPHDE